MLPKIVFDKTVFVKFKISNNFNQNIDETDSKQPKIHRKIHTSLWILKISRKNSANQKSRDFCQMLVISKKNTTPKIYRKSSLWIFILCDFHLCWHCHILSFLRYGLSNLFYLVAVGWEQSGPKGKDDINFILYVFLCPINRRTTGNNTLSIITLMFCLEGLTFS